MAISNGIYESGGLSQDNGIVSNIRKGPSLKTGKLVFTFMLSISFMFIGVGGGII
jgi:hypothetical protein